MFVRRFAPATCLLLDDGTQVELGADGNVPTDARVLTETEQSGRAVERPTLGADHRECDGVATS